MKKRLFLFFILFLFILSFFSCKKISQDEFILSSDGKIFIFDENLKIKKEFDTGLDGKILIQEKRKDKILFNFYSNDYKVSQIYLLDIKTDEKVNITEGLIGSFPYIPKFFNDENVLFTLKESALRDYLYIFNLNIKNKKPILTNIISNYIYPIFLDEYDKKIYIHLLKENEKNSKIALYDFLKDEFIENYITFKENFYFQNIANENGEILCYFFDNKSKIIKIEILNLLTKDYKEVFELKDGEIYNEMFLNDSKNIVFKFVPYDKDKKISIYLIDREGNILKTIDNFEFSDFYIRGFLKNYLFLIAQEKNSQRYSLFLYDLEKNSFKKITDENYFYGGDFIYSKNEERFIISQIKEGKQDKEYVYIDLKKDKKINLNEKLKLKIDSIVFIN
jgi:hypothetical protein